MRGAAFHPKKAKTRSRFPAQRRAEEGPVGLHMETLGGICCRYGSNLLDGSAYIASGVAAASEADTCKASAHQHGR